MTAVVTADLAREQVANAGTVHYVLERVPGSADDAVVREVLELEALGRRVVVDCLLPAWPAHEDLDRLRAAVRLLPADPRWRDLEVRRSHLRWARRSPLRWAGLALRASADAQSWRCFLLAGLIADRADREGVRHLHAHLPADATVVAADAGALSRRPVTVTAHRSDVRDGRTTVPDSGLRGVRAVVTVTEHDAQRLRAAVPRTSVRVIRDAVPLRPARPASARGPVLCVAPLVPEKGIDTLITAFGVLAEDRPSLRLDLIGGGPIEEDLRDQVQLLGLAERVRFRGALPPRDVHEALRTCAMLVLPCRRTAAEDRGGVPAVLLEAMACGAPVVTTTLPGRQELVRDGWTGRLVPPAAPFDLAATMSHLLDDPAGADAMGGAGRLVVGELHSPRRSAEELQRLWQEVSG